MIFAMATKFQTPPSDLLAIKGPVRRFVFDRAVYVFGQTLSNELEAVEGKTSKEIERKRNQIIRKWLPEAAGGRKFKDPAAGR